MRRRAGMSVALLALVVVSGCWPQAGGGPGRRGVDDLESEVTVATVNGLTTAWSAQVGGSAREAIVDGGTVFVVGATDVTALALASGAERWSADVPGGMTPAVVGGRVNVPSSCMLWAFDPASGAPTTYNFTPYEYGDGSTPACESGDALAIDGQVVVPWEVEFTPFGGAYPACSRFDTLYTSGPGVTGLDATSGTQVWERSDISYRCVPPGWPDPGVAPYGPISADAGYVLVPRDATLNAIARGCSQASCPIAWSVAVGSPIVGPAVVLTSGDLAVPTRSAGVVVVDGATHQVEWTATLPAPLAQPVAATATTIVAATTDGSVTAFPAGGCGAASCAPAWSATLTSPASARPSLAGGVAYVGSDDGTVTALAAEGCGGATCAALWTGDVPAAVSGAPAITGGTVVVGASDGTVTAFALPDP